MCSSNLKAHASFCRASSAIDLRPTVLSHGCTSVAATDASIGSSTLDTYGPTGSRWRLAGGGTNSSIAVCDTFSAGSHVSYRLE